MHGAFIHFFFLLLKFWTLNPDVCSSRFYLSSLLSSSQGLVPSGGPEIIRRNWIEIMWYGEGCVCVCRCGGLHLRLGPSCFFFLFEIILFVVLSKALLNVREVEKAADAAAKQPPEAGSCGSCGCNKSCNCTKAPLVFSDLYSTGAAIRTQHEYGTCMSAHLPHLSSVTQLGLAFGLSGYFSVVEERKKKCHFV